MIEVTNIDVWGFRHAIRGARNPMNSWEKSDSDGLHIGAADIDLLQRLYKAGTEHRKYMRQITVSMDITAPLYWWKQFDTYKIGTTANSCSTMHKIAAKEFERKDFSWENISGVDEENELLYMLDLLNTNRRRFLETKDKKYWWNMVQLLPSAYNQKRTVTMNYENVVTMIKQRTGHKLYEWDIFCNTLRSLPYVTAIMGEDA